MFGLSVFSSNPLLSIPGSPCKLLFSNDKISITKTESTDYPISLHKLDRDTLLIIEGKIYDRELESIIATVNAFYHTELKALDNFIFNIDGEFYIYLVDLISNVLHVYGDHLNRLPLYYGRNGTQWMVSRDIYHLTRFHSSTIDRLNLAEYLVLNYNLEERTLFSGIYSLQINRLLRVNMSTGDMASLAREAYHVLPAESTILKLSDKVLDGIVDSFVLSCKNRCGVKNVLSLSGGMDSRSLAVGLKRAGLSYSAVTFEDEDGTATNDVIIAEEIARTLELDWTKIQLDNSSFPDDVYSAVRFKLGIQPSRLYFLYQYCHKVLNAYGGSITFFTGDGGDKVFPDLSDGISFDDNQKLLDHILKEHSEFSLCDAAFLAGVPESDLRNQFLRIVDELPGNQSKLKYEQFILRGRMKRYIFEGEDRNRAYYWSTTPFLSKPFFSLMMSIDRNIKANSEFYRSFVARLDPAIGLIRSEKYSAGGIIVGRKLYALLKNVSNILLSRKNKEYMKSIFKRSKNPNITAQLYRAEIEKYADAASLINMQVVKREQQKYSVGQLSLVVTCIYLERFM